MLSLSRLCWIRLSGSTFQPGCVLPDTGRKAGSAVGIYPAIRLLVRRSFWFWKIRDLLAYIIPMQAVPNFFHSLPFTMLLQSRRAACARHAILRPEITTVCPKVYKWRLLSQRTCSIYTLYNTHSKPYVIREQRFIYNSYTVGTDIDENRFDRFNQVKQTN